MSPSSFDNWCTLPTPMGDFRMYDSLCEEVHLVCYGNIHELGDQPLLRMHSSCLASEVFGAQDCDCADQLRESMKLMANEGRGLIIHLHQEGRGHGLSTKIRAVGLMQRQQLDTVQSFESLGLELDPRTYYPAVEILQMLGLEKVRLISNNPRKQTFLESRGVQTTLVGTHPKIRPENLDYLRSKQAKLDHRFALEQAENATGDIRFYHSDQNHGELSNFSRHAIFLEGRIFPTVEHYYQAKKFDGTAREELIRCAPTPTMAKLLARDWKMDRKEPWSSVKEQIMLSALRAKFSQHPDLRTMLVGTGERTLVEHTALDAYWGDAGDGSGQNRLGSLLMDVRQELRAQGPTAGGE